MRLSKQPRQEKLAIPENWSLMESYKLFEAMGWVEFPYSGVPSYLPIGQKMIRNIMEVIRRRCNEGEFCEVYLPLLQHRRFLESTGRDKLFGNEFMQLTEPLEGMILSPTNEEIYLDTINKGSISYRQLPIKLFQIADKFRNIKKPKGILRSKQFLMCDMVSIDRDSKSLNATATGFERIVEKVMVELGLHAYRIEKEGESYVDYLVPCKEGETIIKIEGQTAVYAPLGEDTHKSSSVAMYFLFDAPMRIKFTDKDGLMKPAHIGTYGFGIQRCLHAVVESHRDRQGINFPEAIRPFDLSLIALVPGEECAQYYQELKDAGLRIVFDDRHGKTLKEKAAFADFYGTPWKIIIGRKELEKGSAIMKNREGNLEMQVSLANLPTDIKEKLKHD
ncbi:MAG: hypothetical protein KJ955_04355 [Nanoarchaeota archaeon]|nr:hypothetical protein [Nanoarchaeota archaeon]